MNGHPNKRTRRGWEAVAALAAMDGGLDTIPGELGHRAVERLLGAGHLQVLMRPDGSIIEIQFNGEPFLRPAGRVTIEHPIIELLITASSFLIGDLAIATSVLRERLEAIRGIAELEVGGTK